MKRVFAAVDLYFFFALDVVRSSLRVAYDVLTPRHRMQPAIIAVDVSALSDRQLLVMANMITMTPGSMGVGLSEDHKTFYVHLMYLDGPVEEAAAGFENGYGRRVRNVFLASWNFQ